MLRDANAARGINVDEAKNPDVRTTCSQWLLQGGQAMPSQNPTGR